MCSACMENVPRFMHIKYSIQQFLMSDCLLWLIVGPQPKKSIVGIFAVSFSSMEILASAYSDIPFHILPTMFWIAIINYDKKV